MSRLFNIIGTAVIVGMFIFILSILPDAIDREMDFREQVWIQQETRYTNSSRED